MLNVTAPALNQQFALNHQFYVLDNLKKNLNYLTFTLSHRVGVSLYGIFGKLISLKVPGPISQNGDIYSNNASSPKNLGF